MATQEITLEHGWHRRRHRPASSRWPLVIAGLGLAALLGVLASQSVLLAILVAGVGTLAAAIVIRPSTATLIVVGLIYTNAAAVGVKSHGLPNAVGYSLPILLVIPLAYLLVVRRERLIFTSAFPWLLGFLVVNIVATLLALDPTPAIAELRSLVAEGVILFFLITNVVRTMAVLRGVIWVIVLAGGFLGAISAYQQITGTYENNYGGFAQVTTQNEGFVVGESGLSVTTQKRSGGPFESGGENRFAQVLLVVVPLALFLVLSERRASLRLLAAFCLAAMSLTIVYTFSRGAAIAFVVLVVLMVLFRAIKLRHFALISIGVAILLASVPSFWVRISTLGALPSVSQPSSGQAADTSIQSRGTENLAALLIFADHAVVGVGPGLYPQYYQRYTDRVGDYSNELEIRQKYSSRQAHNLYLGLLAETGVLGFACFVAMVFLTLRDLNRVRRRSQAAKRELSLLAGSLMLSLIAYLLTGIFLHLAYQRYFFLLLAVCAAASLILSRAAAREDEQTDRAPEQLRYWVRDRGPWRLPISLRSPKRGTVPGGRPARPRAIAEPEGFDTA